MTRAGREPAEDVKRRIVQACSDADLKVTTARMYLSRQAQMRVILVCASLPDWPNDRPMLTLLTTVSVNGDWGEKVDVRCSAAEHVCIREFWNTPTLRGRHDVPINDLVLQLQETIEEWGQVVAAMKLGIPGPYPFKNARWERPSTIME